MPGKVNPTQSEAITMVCAKIIGNDTTISFGAKDISIERFYKPVMMASFLIRVRLIYWLTHAQSVLLITVSSGILSLTLSSN